MHKGRLEAFSDGVFAVIITIMVLDLHVPHGTDVGALRSLLPVFISYVISFLYVGVYWNNHHHLLHATERITGAVLWANLHLLFWLSLAPFTTAWLGQNPLSSIPVAVYGMVLLCAGIAYYILTKTLLAHHAHDSVLSQSIGRDWKGRTSVILYCISVPLAFRYPALACAGYVLVLAMWLLPDPRIEKRVASD